MATCARWRGDCVSWREFRALLGPTRSWPLKGALAAVFAAALPACYFLYSHGCLLFFNEWIKAQGVAGVFAFAIVYVVIAVLLLAPSELMWVAAGVVFDAWGVAAVDLLKVDVEGYEPRVFAGAGRSLDSGRVRAVMCEFNDYWLRHAGSSPRDR